MPIIVTLISFFMLILSFYIDGGGGLYTHNYIAMGDLYQISQLQGSGNNDSIMIILGSVFLFSTCLISSLVTLLSISFKTGLLSLYLLIAIYIFNLMETSDFLEIAYATIWLGKNTIFTLWFMLLIAIIVLIFSQIMTLMKTQS